MLPTDEELRFTNAEFCRFVEEAREQRERADRAEAEVAMLRDALLPFACHSLPGYWTESGNKMRIRVTEGQLCRAWMALNNPHWRDEYAQPAALQEPNHAID